MRAWICMLALLLVQVGWTAPMMPPHPLTDPASNRSPLEFFRQLLAMDAAARGAKLAGLSTKSRAALQRKLAEYDALSPGARELRLQATELRYFLRPLLGLERDFRNRAVAALPEKFRSLVAARLVQWDGLPKETRSAILDNEWMLLGVLRYGPQFAATAVKEGSLPGETAAARERLEAWSSLRPARQQELLGRFHRFFTLNADEKERVLDQLPEYQRVKVFATIDEIRRLPERERLACMDALRRFNEMSVVERAAFIRNAKLWRGLSSGEKEAWRMVVQQFPPLPPGVEMPPVPPGFFSPPAPVNLLMTVK